MIGLNELNEISAPLLISRINSSMEIFEWERYSNLLLHVMKVHSLHLQEIVIGKNRRLFTYRGKSEPQVDRRTFLCRVAILKCIGSITGSDLNLTNTVTEPGIVWATANTVRGERVQFCRESKGCRIWQKQITPTKPSISEERWRIERYINRNRKKKSKRFWVFMEDTREICLWGQNQAMEGAAFER